MERGDKILKNGIFVISTCQKLTEILQVKFIYFSAIYANNVRRDGVGWKIFAVGKGLKQKHSSWFGVFKSGDDFSIVWAC